MSSDGSVSLAWADGDYRFRLPIGQLRELQDKCGAGPQEIYSRLMDGTWRVDDLRETIRLGLIGGGVDPVRALALVRNYVDPPERPSSRTRSSTGCCRGCPEPPIEDGNPWHRKRRSLSSS